MPLREVSRLSVARLWLSLHSGLVGLLLAIVIASVLAGGRYIHLGPATHLVGTVERFEVQSTKTGVKQTVRVRLPDRDLTVDLPFRRSCEVGSQIYIDQQWGLWGPSFQPVWPFCASALPN
jgi:hypothetical protein